MTKLLRITLGAAILSVAFIGAVANATDADDYFKSASPVATPDDWTAPDDGKSTRNANFIELVGNGAATEWLSAPVKFEPRKLYRVKFRGSSASEASGDCAPVGTNFAHYDFHGFPAGKIPVANYDFTFFVPDNAETGNLRLAQWETERTYHFADIKLVAIQPMFALAFSEEQDAVFAERPVKVFEVLPLGSGETLKDGEYHFRAFSSYAATNYDRPLYSTTSTFNSSRWTLGGEAEVVYRLALEPKKLEITRPAPAGRTDVAGKCAGTRQIPLESGSVSVNIGHYVSGKVVVSASFDGENWTQLGELAGVGSNEFSLAEAFGDATPGEVFIRLRGAAGSDGKGCSAQVYGFEATLKTVAGSADAFNGVGKTAFAEIADEATNAEDERLWGFDSSQTRILFRKGDEWRADACGSVTIAKTAQATEPTDNERRFPMDISYTANIKGKPSFSFATYPYFTQNYTRAIPGFIGAFDGLVTWTEPDRRVPLNPRELTVCPPAPIQVSAAKNDVESFQIVLQPQNGLKGIEGAVLGDLIGENGATIPAENVELRYAYYHYVDNPSDRICAVGWYPDALIPLSQGLISPPYRARCLQPRLFRGNEEIE
ncbi:MAG: hypothetical protein HUK22_05175 [Thermoguttaceae bacterium]|nr:hypothetical protein [Thermoguttaceae bacterium]